MPRFGRSTTSPRGAPRRWTRTRVLSELKQFVGERQVLPTAAELNAAGRADLRRAMRLWGDAAFWAAELGVRLRPGQDRRAYTTAEAQRDFEAVLASVGAVPHAGAIRRLGYARLASYVERRGGAAAVLETFKKKGLGEDAGCAGPAGRVTVVELD
jgi:hypothetical protein